MKEEIRAEDKVVCVPVATSQARTKRLATQQLPGEVEWWDSSILCWGLAALSMLPLACAPAESRQGSWGAVLVNL